MLTNRHAEVESPPVSDQSSAPPDWYTDPEDESQYRYWDGSAWTQHRAPRHVEQERPALRGPLRLLGDSFSTVRRQWPGYALPAVLAIAAQVLTVVLVLYSADLILMGEFDEAVDRLSDPATPETEAYFESLEADFSVLNFVPAAIGLLLLWLTTNLLTAAASILTVGNLRGESFTVSKVFRQAWRRVPRIFGVDLQIAGLLVLILALIVLSGVFVPALLFLLIPATLVVGFMSVAILPVVYAVASVGPDKASLPYAARLVRGRFWGVFGRMFLVSAIVGGGSVLVTNVIPLFGLFSLLGELIVAAISVALALIGIVAPAILYLDLGGETDQEPETESEST